MKPGWGSPAEGITERVSRPFETSWPRIVVRGQVIHEETPHGRAIADGTVEVMGQPSRVAVELTHTRAAADAGELESKNILSQLALQARCATTTKRSTCTRPSGPGSVGSAGELSQYRFAMGRRVAIAHTRLIRLKAPVDGEPACRRDSVQLPKEPGWPSI